MNIEQLIKQCADLADGLKLNTTIHIETNSPYTSANIVAIIKTKEIRSYLNYQGSTLAGLGEGSNLEEALINLKMI